MGALTSPGCPLAPVLVMAIDLAPTLFDLADWWGRHQQVLRMLDEEGLRQVVAAKDRRRAALG